MKRTLITIMSVVAASAAFAAPVSAADTTADSAAVSCNVKYLKGCIDELTPVIAINCHPATECARALAIWVINQADPEAAVNLVIDTVNSAGPVVGDVCRAVFPDCGKDLPVLGG